MKKYLILFAFAILGQQFTAKAQATLAMSPVYYVGNDTLPAYWGDSLLVWVKNVSPGTSFTGTLVVHQAVQDSANTTYHEVDSLITFIPVTIPAGDSLPFTFSQYYDIDSATRYHYDINVIVIWPVAMTATTGDSLTFNQYITLNTGVPELDLQELIKAWPNPFGEQLNLGNSEKIAIEEVRIFDARGRMVACAGKTNSLNTSGWNKGLYMIQIRTTEGRSATIKVLKR